MGGEATRAHSIGRDFQLSLARKTVSLLGPERTKPVVFQGPGEGSAAKEVENRMIETG